MLDADVRVHHAYGPATIALLIATLFMFAACSKYVPVSDDWVEAEFVNDKAWPDPYVKASVAPTLQESPPNIPEPVAEPSARPPLRRPATVTLTPDNIQAKTPKKRKLRTASVIERGNAAARVSPDPSNYVNAEQRYGFQAGKLYSVFTAPGRITTIILEPGEELSYAPFIADLKSWAMVSDATVGTGPDERPIITIMPYHPDLSTSIHVATNRRLYLLEVLAYKRTYMPVVSWHYPEREQAARTATFEQQQAHRRLMAQPRIHPHNIHTGYLIKVDKGKAPDWTPREVFHDGRQTYLTFGPQATEAPALYIHHRGKKEVVQFRVRWDEGGGMTYIVDQVLHKAELTLVDGDTPSEGPRVLIELARRPNA